VDQKEEGRTVTVTIEAEVDPEEVRTLVGKKLTGQPSPATDGASVESVPASSLDFTVFLSKYENRAASFEKQLEKNQYDQALAGLQDMDTLLNSFPKRPDDRFQTLMLNSLSLHNRILMDFTRWDRARPGGRGIRERAGERAIRLRLKQMESGLSELRELENLTEKQKAIRSVWLIKCRQLGSKLKKALG
jgi:hypothetical protein